MLLFGGREGRGAETCVERGDMRNPGRLGLGEVLGGLSGPGEHAGHIGHPTRGDPLVAPAQVAAWDAQQVLPGPGQRGEQLVVLSLGLLCPQAQVALGGLALLIGEQRVIVHRCGKGPFHQSQQHHEVEVQADPHAHRRRQDAVAHAPDPSEIGLELELQRPCKHVETHRALHALETGKAVERALHLFGCLRFDEGPPCPVARTAQQIVEATTGPGHVVGPPPRPGRRRRQVVDEAQYECAQFSRVCCVRGEPLGAPIRGVRVERRGIILEIHDESREQAVPITAAGHDTGVT